MAVAATVALAALAVAAPPAGAHLHAQPATVAAGSLAVVTLAWEDGCDGSPTRSLAVQLPLGSTEVRLLPPAGWDAAGPDLESGVATFTARPGAEVPDGAVSPPVAIELRVPEGRDRLVLPTVQTCTTGELSWLDEAATARRAAPAVEVVAPGEAGGSHATDREEHTTTSVQVVGPTPPANAPSAPSAAPLAVTADDGDDGDGGGLGAGRLVAIVVAAALAGLVGSLALRRGAGRR